MKSSTHLKSLYFFKRSIHSLQRERAWVPAGGGGREKMGRGKDSQADFPLNVEPDTELDLMTQRS